MMTLVHEVLVELVSRSVMDVKEETFGLVTAKEPWTEDAVFLMVYTSFAAIILFKSLPLL